MRCASIGVQLPTAAPTSDISWSSEDNGACICVCNSLLFRISDSLLQRLQAFQDAAVRLVTSRPTRRRGRITPVLRQLHWQPVRKHIEFKLAELIHKAMNGLSPQYLADDCQLVTTSRRRLRSSNVARCEVPRTYTSLSDRSFTVATEFRRLLKTHLFSWDRHAYWLLCLFEWLTNVLTYLEILFLANDRL